MAAGESLLVDYLQLMQLIMNLQNDTSVKASKRDDIRKILKSLADGRVLINAVALHSALAEGIAPYQL